MAGSVLFPFHEPRSPRPAGGSDARSPSARGGTAGRGEHFPTMRWSVPAPQLVLPDTAFSHCVSPTQENNGTLARHPESRQDPCAPLLPRTLLPCFEANRDLIFQFQSPDSCLGGAEGLS